MDFFIASSAFLRAKKDEAHPIEMGLLIFGIWNTDRDGACCLFIFSIKMGEAVQTGSVPVEVVEHGDPPFPVSGVIKDVIPRQRRFTSVFTERLLLICLDISAWRYGNQ
jgi:hypothetical protein